jgi:hypothetical protein
VPTRARTSGDGFQGSLLSTCRHKAACCERCQTRKRTRQTRQAHAP